MPGGRARLAVYIGFNIEHFAFGEGLARRSARGLRSLMSQLFVARLRNRSGLALPGFVRDAEAAVGALINTALYDYCPK